MLMPWHIPNTVRTQVKQNDSIIYGRRALNAQLPRTLHRGTIDFDVWSKNPARSANQLQASLDNVVRHDGYYDEAWKSKSGKRVYSVIEKDTKEVIADFTEMPDRSYFKIVGGVKYQTLQNAKIHYHQILNDPLLKKRWSKAKGDLWHIEKFEKQLRNGQRTFLLKSYPFKVIRRY